ncbi:hypothetical protein [Streptantibioticus ferralitis]|uniref:Uncharacterized protein n=1 Tax=Streptantibioticus ferralitis TaxID=236510 RepID=A0ABT5ZBD4_9ACTN|nr:hypothetical protein [Streptantibioticus ferralitis]MDF2261028.1 hypothetical protein [Streptantibioticus ferralitis]
MNLHVVVVIIVAVGNLELSAEVQREHRRTVERVSAVLEQKTVGIWRFRQVMM